MEFKIDDKENIDASNPFAEEVDGFVVEADWDGKRLDLFTSEQYTDISRSNIQKLIKENRILVNSKKEKASYKVSTGDLVTVAMPEPKELLIEAQDIDIEIVYEDDDLLIVNKPQGMVVHPAPGNPDKTLVNAIMYHCKGKLSSINGVIRPGIVHRIDKNTSGLLVVAKNNNAHKKLAEQFAVHSITREYEMICSGRVDWDKKTVDTLIGRNPKNRLKMSVIKSGGKRAVTHFEVLEDLSGFTYMKATLETGRTHQIRVHSSYLKHPIIGDNIYGYPIKKFAHLEGQMLHARKLGFIHPTTGEYLEFTSDLPDYFKKALNIIRHL
ncbi:MAG: Ribosomal large subunit pseudouridine synthase D [Peptostreptococcus russellii]|uniref:Pseudouridine synthase n=1 Tax=Peptostreptococcus russellii TaxID=215200 RepID=A0A2P7Q072_9FIRM|nr:RluA family pseudouridine synthase [Peptostreptococcus russellii]PSJ31364.1 pseudouridine synthase [Peptostreptococcus russellii]